ncbi:MAG TPA: hypothetical protein VFM25_03425 [Verrucomicrobiae bacterium]|nr:hypothetical protein [Verrucomicrobiae bacterium]
MISYRGATVIEPSLLGVVVDGLKFGVCVSFGAVAGYMNHADFPSRHGIPARVTRAVFSHCDQLFAAKVYRVLVQ